MSDSPLRRVLWPHVARHRGALAGAAGATVVTTAAQLAQPWPLKFVIDRLLAQPPGQSLGMDDALFLAGVAALLVVIAAVGALAAYASDVWLNRAGERIVHEMRVAVYAQLQRLSLAYHQGRTTGDLVTRITGDVGAVGTLFTESLGTVVSAALLLVGMAIVTLLLDPALAVVTFAVAPVLAFVTVRFRRRLTELARKQRAQEGQIASLAAEALAAAPVVKAFGSEDYEESRVASRSELRRVLGVEAARTEARFSGIVDTLGAVSAALVLVVGAVRVSGGHLTPGDLVVFAAYAQKTYRPLRDIARQAGKISRGFARAERLTDVMVADERIPDVGGEGPAGRAVGALSVTDLRFGYRSDAPVLDGVSLEAAPGMRVAVVGHSGAGKSTLAALVARFYDPTAGTLSLDGRDLRDLPLGWLRSQVGLLLQDTMLFSGTIAENIAYGVQATRAEVVAAARVARADAFIENLPDGYETYLSAGSGLSGGQRQRIGIARVVLRDPAVLVLDEPTTGLDARSEAELVESLEGLMSGRTTLIVTHSIALATRADQVVVLDGGRVVERGKPDALLAQQGQFRDLAQRQGVVAGQGLRRRGRPLPPLDPGLPAATALLDEVAAADVVKRALAVPALSGVTIRQVEIQPTESIAVRYDIEIAGQRLGVVATTTRAGGTTARERVDARDLLARRGLEELLGRTLGVDPRTGIEAFFLPFDPSLPLLAEPAARLGQRLRQVGIDATTDLGEPELLSYRAGRSGVLRLDRHIVKTYATLHAAHDGWRGLAFAAAQGFAAGPRAFLPNAKATVQPLVEGAPVAREQAREVGAEAGAFLRRLQALDGAGLSPLTASSRLVRAALAADMVASLHPEMGPRLDAIVEALQEGLPRRERLVPAHGDFNASQLIAGNCLGVVDFDSVCCAGPALDPATFAANLVGGRPGDLAAALEALEALLGGYGCEPADLDWHLAAALVLRTPSPFRLWKRNWPERIESIVKSAEQVLARRVTA